MRNGLTLGMVLVLLTAPAFAGDTEGLQAAGTISGSECNFNVGVGKKESLRILKQLENKE